MCPNNSWQQSLQKWKNYRMLVVTVNDITINQFEGIPKMEYVKDIIWISEENYAESEILK